MNRRRGAIALGALACMILFTAQTVLSPTHVSVVVSHGADEVPGALTAAPRRRMRPRTTMPPTPTPDDDEASEGGGDTLKTTQKHDGVAHEIPLATARGCTVLPVVANLTDTFKVSYCAAANPSGCAFGAVHVEVLGKACAQHQDAAKPLSKDKAHAAWIRKQGPETFRLRLDGPTVQVLPQARVKDCEYVFRLPSTSTSTASDESDGDAPGRLGFRGLYRLGLEWLHSYYNGLDEVSNQWPPLLKIPLLDPIEVRTAYHLQQMTLPSHHVFRCSDGPSLGAAATAAPSGSSRALCDGVRHNARDGVWQLTGRPETVATRVRVRKLRKKPILFLWAIQTEPDVAWVARGCSLLPTTPSLSATLRKHLKPGLKIVVGGDSQLRALYYGIANVLNGHEVVCIRNITSVDGEPRQCIENVKGSQRKNIAGVQLDFVDDHFLNRVPTGRYDDYNVVIVGYAQHPASKEHWTVGKYRASLGSRIDKLRQLKAKGAAVVWYHAPQYPHTPKGYPVHVKDWRTDPRVALFNAVAESEFLRPHGIPSVDAFAISTAMSHTSPDQAHYTNWVSFELVRATLTAVVAQNDA